MNDLKTSSIEKQPPQLKHNLHNKKLNRYKATLKFLNTPEKLEERKRVHESLKNCKAREELQSIFKVLSMDNECLELIFIRIQECLAKELKTLTDQLKIFPFGSIVTKLALRDCDIDIYIDASSMQLKRTGGHSSQQNVLDFKSDPILNRKIFNRIYRALTQSKRFLDVLAIRSARVPIIKCKHKDTGFSVDINLSCPNSVDNTRFLQALVESDFRIHSMLLFLKIWAKNMQIVKYGNMTSYCLIILAIFYLQQPLENYNAQPILLPIQKLQTNCVEHLVQGVNYAFEMESNENKPFLPSSISTFELIKGFFRFYKNCDLSSYVLSPYLGHAVLRNDFSNNSINFHEYHNQLDAVNHYFNKDADGLRIDACICVQDPFYLNQNVAKSINGVNKEYFEYCLTNAYEICGNNDNVPMVELYEKLIYDLCDPVVFLPTKANELCIDLEGNLNQKLEKRQELDYEKQQYISFVFEPKRNDIKAILPGDRSSTSHLQIYKCWSKCYIKAVEIILSQLYRLEIKENPIAREGKQPLLDSSSKCEYTKSWFISGSIDLWTNRFHHKTHDKTFMEYHLDQTERLYRARFQNPHYSADINALLTLTVAMEYQSIELRLHLSNGLLPITLNKKHPIRRFFTMLKCTIANFNLKEALQSSLICKPNID
uniref:PAP-associated domain-containing protein n=1 Tax=Glossina brevipalpis TaxID=37001 RepID=A0A1A9W724_9MUSC